MACSQRELLAGRSAIIVLKGDAGARPRRLPLGFSLRARYAVVAAMIRRGVRRSGRVQEEASFRDHHRLTVPSTETAACAGLSTRAPARRRRPSCPPSPCPSGCRCRPHVERHQRPALPRGLVDEAGHVEQLAPEPVKLGNHQRVHPSRLEGAQHEFHARPVDAPAAHRGVFNDLH